MTEPGSRVRTVVNESSSPQPGPNFVILMPFNPIHFFPTLQRSAPSACRP